MLLSINNESYFTTPYFQGENSTMEDKDMKDFLVDLPLLHMSKPVLSPHFTVSNPVPESMPDLVSAPMLD